MLIWYSPQAPNKLATLPSLRKVEISRGNNNNKGMCAASFPTASHDGRAKTYSFEGSVESTFCQSTFLGKRLQCKLLHLGKLLMLQKSIQTLLFCADSIASEKLSALNILDCVWKLEAVLTGTSLLRNTGRYSQCVPVIIADGNVLIYERWIPSHLCPKSLSPKPHFSQSRLLQTEGSGSEWKSKYPELILGSLILQAVAIQGPDKLCLIPCVFFWLHPELGFLD